jgi:hypothetical protein
VAKRGQFVRFLREICPGKKMTPKYNAASGIIAGELLIPRGAQTSLIY